MRALLIVVMLCGCTRTADAKHTRTLYFRGEAVATVDESVRDRVVTRRISLGRERITLTAHLDAEGRALRAHYARPGMREIDLASEAGHGIPALQAQAGQAGHGVPALHVKNAVLIDLLQHVQPPVTLDVNLVDLSSAESMPGRVERRGAEVVALDVHGGVIARANVEGRRIGPGAFVEGNEAPPSAGVSSVEIVAPGKDVRGWRLLGVDDVLAAMNLDGPGQHRDGDRVLFDGKADDVPVESDRAPSPLIESDDARVVAFAKPHGGGEPLVDAARLVEAIHPLVDPRMRDVPPSAINMLTKGGDCDGAAALLTASLRALGHAARPVVGYRHVDEKLIPHAWVEVHTPEGWLLVDAAAPRIGSAPTHLKLFNGLGGALTMGRVLGRLRVEPIP